MYDVLAHSVTSHSVATRIGCMTGDLKVPGSPSVLVALAWTYTSDA